MSSTALSGSVLNSVLSQANIVLDIVPAVALDDIKYAVDVSNIGMN